MLKMTTRKTQIISLPNERLRQRSKKVGIVNENIKKIVKNMEISTLEWEDRREHEVGVALAAVQIDQLLRIIIIRNNFEDKSDRGFKVFINPVITKYEGEIEEDFEGCLSISDIYGKVPRYHKVRVRAQSLDGKSIKLVAEGFLARVFQHEVDHLKGTLFIDHIKDKKEAFFHLEADGQLKDLDYEKDVRTNRILW